MQKYLKWNVYFFVTCSHTDEQESQENNSSSHDVGGWITQSAFLLAIELCACVCVWEHSRWK